MEVILPLIFAVVTIIAFAFILFLRNSRDANISRKLDMLKEDIAQNLNKAQTDYFNSFNSVFAQLSKLYEKMGGLDRESKEIHNLTRTFQNILVPVKKRGGLGENLAENLLKEVLPEETVIRQYMFRDGKRVDFAIKLPEAIVPIDAKFSLDSFRNYREAEGREKKAKRREFIEGIKKRISETAQYIYPDEGTVDFVFMYVPSEAVYYFIITETNLSAFARAKKVFIAGPNTLYIYLNTLCIGFRALKMEKNAKQIYAILGRLEKDVGTFLKEYGVLGTHLRSANSKYQELSQKMDSLSLQLRTIEKEKNEI